MKLRLSILIGILFFAACSSSSDPVAQDYEPPYSAVDAEDIVDMPEAPEALGADKIEKIEFAARIFARLQAGWDYDNGEMWGMPLHSPVIFHCAETDFIMSNRQNASGELDEFYVNGITVHTGFRHMPLLEERQYMRLSWYGETGVFVSFQYVLRVQYLYLSPNYYVPSYGGLADMYSPILMLVNHYIMHALQPSLMRIDGAPMQATLDEEGANSYRLEVDALITAIEAEGETRLALTQQALSIRQARRDTFGTTYAENRIKLSEGTAVYTEFLISFMGADGRAALLYHARWFQHLTDPLSLAIQYGYTGGALYGLLLDAFEIEWRPYINVHSDLGQLLIDALGIDLE